MQINWMSKALFVSLVLAATLSLGHAQEEQRWGRRSPAQTGQHSDANEDCVNLANSIKNQIKEKSDDLIQNGAAELGVIESKGQ